jgi:hypothetical protein
MKRIVFALATALLTCSSLFAAQPKSLVTLPITYTFATITDPGNKTDYLLGIDDYGYIVGYAGEGKGFTIVPSSTCPSKCTFKPENYPGAAYTGVFGINNNNNLESAGTWIDKSGKYHGFLRNSNNWWDVVYPGTTNNYLYGLNDDNVAAGFYYDGDYNAHAYIYSQPGNQYTPLIIPGNDYAWASGINDYNTVVGTYIDSTGASHGFVFTPSFVALNYPGAYDTWATGVNNYGAISGYFYDEAGFHGFVYYGGAWQEIDNPASPGETIVWGINDYFDLVGYGETSPSYYSGFLATPQPD